MFNVPLYGHNTWSSLFTPRQALALTTLGRLVRKVGENLANESEQGFSNAIQTCLSLAVERLSDFNSSLARWANNREGSAATFGRQALPMLWDFGETCPISTSTGSLHTSIELVANVLEKQNSGSSSENTIAEQSSATRHPLPNESVNLLCSNTSDSF